MSKTNNEITWTNERGDSFTGAQRALERCKRREQKLIASGYRMVKVDSITELLVECDADGNPTRIGAEKINEWKKNTGR